MHKMDSWWLSARTKTDFCGGPCCHGNVLLKELKWERSVVSDAYYV